MPDAQEELDPDLAHLIRKSNEILARWEAEEARSGGTGTKKTTTAIIAKKTPAPGAPRSQLSDLVSCPRRFS